MDPYGLDSSELFWSKRYNFFLSKGYTLRVRYSPSWVPSWQGRRGMDALPQLHEDYVKIADPANHCVPVIDHFEDDEEPNIHYIVMPLLRPCLDPEFATIAEVLDFMRQVLQHQGIKFMHDNNVSHRDCVAQNIMMDAQYLCPDGWHPIHYQESRDFTGNLHHKKRSEVDVVYYFIDFGLSILHPPGQTLLITGAEGRDDDVPELSDHKPYDPFKVDIYIVGHMFETEFLSKYEGLENLLPLIRHMTTRLPDERPNAETALKSFEMICNISAFSTSLRTQQRLRGLNESATERVAKDLASTARHTLNHIWS
ncbi:kinase-like domain-containing protein [Melanogaster broomeanus]|nr:kinase-like domain-containing protein [Melanogaster broomeanus]